MKVVQTVELQERFKAEGITAKIRINDNIRTYVSVTRVREKKAVILSLHRIFLTAPEDVLEALISYVAKNEKNAKVLLRKFVSQTKGQLNYSHRINEDMLETEGRVYNIKEIFNSINERYFEGQLNLFVTYFGKENRRAKSATLGLYCDARKLIKIHKMLDHSSVPRYVVEYIMYHEMLHAVMPSSCTSRGFISVHDRAFRTQEKIFSHFIPAKVWIKQHLQAIGIYGRAQ